MTTIQVQNQLQKFEIEELTENEMTSTSGGFLFALGAAVTVYGALFAVAYGAGALYGIATKD